MAVSAVVFDVGNVLYRWSPKALYERLIPEDRALDAFLENVVTTDWHFQHDAGRDFAETSAELIARFPEHRDLILAWKPRFNETITGAIEGMVELVADLDSAGVPIFGITSKPGIPNLAGLSPEYLVGEMKEYAGGRRKHAVMNALLAAANEADFNDIARYYARQVPARANTPALGDAATGKAISVPCAGCHGQQGIAPAPIPSLAGQDARYISDALHA